MRVALSKIMHDLDQTSPPVGSACDVMCASVALAGHRLVKLRAPVGSCLTGGRRAVAPCLTPLGRNSNLPRINRLCHPGRFTVGNKAVTAEPLGKWPVPAGFGRNAGCRLNGWTGRRPDPSNVCGVRCVQVRGVNERNNPVTTWCKPTTPRPMNAGLLHTCMIASHNACGSTNCAAAAAPPIAAAGAATLCTGRPVLRSTTLPASFVAPPATSAEPTAAPSAGLTADAAAVAAMPTVPVTSFFQFTVPRSRADHQ